MPQMKRYLADGVYAACENGAILLTAENGIAVHERIVADEDVLEQLEDYISAARTLGLIKPRQRPRRQVAPELLGHMIESAEVYAKIRETLRAHVAELEMKPERPSVDEQIDAATKAVAKALYEFPVQSRVAAEMRDRFEVEEREHRDTIESHQRAAAALCNAGVPHEVGCTDPLEQLAARVRWLHARRPIIAGSKAQVSSMVREGLQAAGFMAVHGVTPSNVETIVAAICAALGVQ